jgi:hypothetical protein
MIKRVIFADGNSRELPEAWGVRWSDDGGLTWHFDGPFATRAEALERRFRLIVRRSGPHFVSQVVLWPGGPEVA